MAGGAMYTVTVAFSIATGSAAGLLSLLTWEALRRSPFGRAVFVLTGVMVLFMVYHVLVLVTPELPAYTDLFKAVLFTGVAVFVWMLVWSQHRMRTRYSTEQVP